MIECQHPWLARNVRHDEDGSYLRIHRHLLSQSHAEGGVNLNRRLLDGYVLLEHRTRLQQPTHRVLRLTQLLLQATDRLVEVIHLLLYPNHWLIATQFDASPSSPLFKTRLSHFEGQLLVVDGAPYELDDTIHVTDLIVRSFQLELEPIPGVGDLLDTGVECAVDLVELVPHLLRGRAQEAVDLPSQLL